MSTNKKNNSTSTNKKKAKFSVNPLLITVIILVLIPVSILGYSIVKSVDTRGVPVVGGRYDEELPNKLTQEQISQIKSSISAEGMESADVTLNAATLRVTIKVPTMTTNEEAETIVRDAYEVVNSIAPIEKHFTNIDGEKGYDLEIHAYNFIPKTDEEKASQVYTILTKTGSMTGPLVNVQTTARSQALADHLLDPITEEQLLALKAALSVEGMESNEVKSVGNRVIVSVKVPGLSDVETAKVLCEEVYEQVNSVLPIETYFTNKEEVQRYGLEIHVFNMIPKEGEDVSQQVAASLSKASRDASYKLSTNEESE